MMNAPLLYVAARAQGGWQIDKVGGRSTTKENAMQRRTLGSTGPAVSALGLGAMGMTAVPRQ